MLPRFKAFFFLVISTIFLSSCGDLPLASNSIEIDSDGWNSIDSTSFEWEVVDLDLRYNAFIDIRHNADYPYSNLYLYLDFTFPNGKQRRDTLACILADERGRWYGSGIGDFFDYRVPFRVDFEFRINGNYRLNVVHGMRRNPLPGITDLGLRIEKSQSSP